MTITELSERFRITRVLLEAVGVRHETDAEVRELLGVHGRARQDLGGIVFPYRDPRDSRVLSHRVRLDIPVADGQKYLSEQDCRVLFFPPTRDSELTDISCPAVIVESEKAALALTALAARNGQKLLVVATGGVYGWRRKIGIESTADGEREVVTGPSPSFDWVVWGGRKAIVAFDSNVAGRRDLERARLSLAKELLNRGAQVFIASTPRRIGVNGPDDLIAVAGDDAALQMLDRAAPFAHVAVTPPTQTGFVLTRLSDLFNKPDKPVDYVLENVLVAGGLSGVFAKPKVGKSTFARNLCLAVSRGEDFLGLKTKKGECIYLALEEREEDIRQDFRAMGADGSEPIYVHAASAPAEGIVALCDLVRERKPVLVVIDPLFRLARIRDEKAYAETYTALGPLIDVAREIGTHVMFSHHAGKGMKADSVDSPLGSTAIGGAVSTLVVLKRTRNRRTIETVQRVGADIPETVLEFESNTRRLTLGGTRFDSERQECEMEILEFLKSASDPQTQEQIRDGVEGQTRVIRAALTALVAAARVDRTGDGKKGKPFLYAFPNSGSEHIAGTRKPESEGQGEVTEKNERIPVPENSQPSMVVSDVEQGDDTVRL
ncbi:MAG: AAA family ATPase [Candidatus Acidiferrales bacterium]